MDDNPKSPGSGKQDLLFDRSRRRPADFEPAVLFLLQVFLHDLPVLKTRTALK
jgi:hypothetical protein